MRALGEREDVRVQLAQWGKGDGGALDGVQPAHENDLRGGITFRVAMKCIATAAKVNFVSTPARGGHTASSVWPRWGGTRICASDACTKRRIL